MVIFTNPVNVSLQVTQRQHRALAPRATYQSAEAPVEWTAATMTPPPRRPLAALQLISVRPPVAPGALLLWTTRATWLVSWPQRSWPLSPVLEPAVQRQAPPSKEMWVMFAKKKKKWMERGFRTTAMREELQWPLWNGITHESGSTENREILSFWNNYYTLPLFSFSLNLMNLHISCPCSALTQVSSFFYSAPVI